MEAKSHSLQSIVGDPGELVVEAPVPKQGVSIPKKSQRFSLSPKAGDRCPSSRESGRVCFFPLVMRGSAFLFYSGLRLIGRCPPILGGALCFLACGFQCESHPNTPLQTHSESCLTKYLGIPWPSQVDT